MQYYHTIEDNQSIKQNIISMYIKTYVQNNYTINGEYYSIEEVGTLLKVPVSILQCMLNEYMQNSEIQRNPEYSQAIARDIIFRANFLALEATHKARKQLLTLEYSQAGQYQPFISSEVNKAIKNVMDGANTMANLAEKMLPKTSAFNIINNGQTATVNNLILTPDMATKAIEDTLKSQYQEVGSEAHLALISSRNPSSSLALPTIEATAEIEATVEKKALQRKAQDTEDLSNEELRELKSKQALIIDL